MAVLPSPRCHYCSTINWHRHFLHNRYLISLFMVLINTLIGRRRMNMKVLRSIHATGKIHSRVWLVSFVYAEHELSLIAPRSRERRSVSTMRVTRATKEKQKVKNLLRNTSNEGGQALIEFALCLPVLVAVAMGIFSFGLVLNNYLTLTNATNVSAQLLSISRGQSSDPCATAAQAFYPAAPSLTQSSLKFTIALGGTVVWGPAGGTVTCSSATLVEGQSAQVTVTYPCSFTLYGFNPQPSCTLKAQTAEAIQ